MTYKPEDVRIGDTVTARYGDCTVKGPIKAYGCGLLLFGRPVEQADEILEVIPVWRSAQVIKAVAPERDKKLYLVGNGGFYFYDGEGISWNHRELKDVEVIVK